MPRRMIRPDSELRASILPIGTLRRFCPRSYARTIGQPPADFPVYANDTIAGITSIARIVCLPAVMFDTGPPWSGAGKRLLVPGHDDTELGRSDI